MTVYAGVRFPPDGFANETDTCGYRVKIVMDGSGQDMSDEDEDAPKRGKREVYRPWCSSEHTDEPVFTCGKRRGMTFDEVMEKDPKFTRRVLEADYIYTECIASFREYVEKKRYGKVVFKRVDLGLEEPSEDYEKIKNAKLLYWGKKPMPGPSKDAQKMPKHLGKSYEWVYENDTKYVKWLINAVREVEFQPANAVDKRAKHLPVRTDQAHGFMCKYWDAYEYFLCRYEGKFPHRLTKEGMPTFPQDYDDSDDI